MYKIDATTVSQQYLHRIMLGSIAPRPIAFVSTVDKEGRPNLAPFSFFNAFGVNPATLVFSPSRRGRDNTTKHTYENLLEVPECVINVVNYSMVQQMSLASCEFPKGVNEFEKAGFTAIASESVKPFRVKESPVQYECKVRQIVAMGDGPGAGNLVICDVMLVHIDPTVLDEKNEINQETIDLVGRMGGDYYVRTNRVARFVVEKPVSTNGIGIDSLPEHIRLSPLLTGNQLGQLGNLQQLPSEEAIGLYSRNDKLVNLFKEHPTEYFEQAVALLEKGCATDALAMLLAVNDFQQKPR